MRVLCTDLVQFVFAGSKYEGCWECLVLLSASWNGENGVSK